MQDRIKYSWFTKAISKKYAAFKQNKNPRQTILGFS